MITKTFYVPARQQSGTRVCAATVESRATAHTRGTAVVAVAVGGG